MQAIALMLSATAMFGLDQASKAFLISWQGEGRIAGFGPVILRRVLNTGNNGGFRRNNNKWLTAFWLAEIAVLAAAVQFVPHLKATAPIALGMALGGAGSNLFDRLWREGVIDFIDVGFWPVFNLADVGIVVGVVVGVASL